MLGLERRRRGEALDDVHLVLRGLDRTHQEIASHRLEVGGVDEGELRQEVDSGLHERIAGVVEVEAEGRTVRAVKDMPRLAALLDQKIRFEGVFRTIFLYPFALSFVVTGLTWQWILNPDFGVQHVVPLQTWPPVHVLHVIFPPVMQTLSTVVLHAPAAQFASAQHEPAVPLGAGLPGGPPTMQL